MLSANQEDCELRYPRKTTRILTVVAFAGIAIVVYLAQWALRNTESGSVALGAAVFAVIGAVMTVSLLQARRWLRERVVARAESLDFVGNRGCSVSVPWSSIESLRFHGFSASSIPFFSVLARGRRPVARVYMHGESVNSLLEVIAMRSPVREPLRLPIVLKRRSWLGAGVRLAAALAPVAFVAVYLARSEATATAWVLASLGVACGAGYLSVLYISPLSTRIEGHGIVVKRRFKGDIAVRYEDLDNVHLGLPFGRAASGPRIIIFPRTRRAFFLDTTAERSVALFPVIRRMFEQATEK